MLVKFAGAKAWNHPYSLAAGRPACSTGRRAAALQHRRRATADDSNQECGPSSWAAENVSGSGLSNQMSSHDLPWQGYISRMLAAMEAEADAKHEMKEAHATDSLSSVAPVQPAAASDQTSQTVPGKTSDTDTPGDMPPSSSFTMHIQRAMEAQHAASWLREAAEKEAKMFFKKMSSREPPATNAGAARPYYGYDIGYDYSSSSSNSSKVTPFAEIEASLQQGMQLASDRWTVALQLARSIIDATAKALSVCAEKIKLEMSLEPVGSQQRQHQQAALVQLQALQQETMADLADTLATRFLPEYGLSVEEARQWLEDMWLLSAAADADRGTDRGPEC